MAISAREALRDAALGVSRGSNALSKCLLYVLQFYNFLFSFPRMCIKYGCLEGCDREGGNVM